MTGVVHSRLPQELLDHIIHCVGDGSTLLICCLVCSSWLPASRHSLFRIIRINHPDTFNLLVSRVLQSGRLRSYLASVFELHYSDEKLPPAGTVGQGDIISRVTCTHVSIQEFAGHMPNLALLIIRDLDWHHYPLHPSTFLMFSQFPAIRELRLSSCYFPSWNTFRRVLICLPALTTLDLVYVSWPRPSADLPLVATNFGRFKPSRTRLSSLSIAWLGSSNHDDPHCADWLFTWLSTTPTPSSLRTLCLRVPTSPEWWSTARWTHIGLNGHVLLSFVRLSSTLCISVLERGADDHLLIPQLLNLEKTVLELEPPGPSSGTRGWARCSEILHALPAPTRLEAIEIYASGSFLYDHGPYEGMDALDPLLEDNTPFKRVRHVILVLRDAFYVPLSKPRFFKAEATDNVRRKVPRLLSRPFVELWLEFRERPSSPASDVDSTVPMPTSSPAPTSHGINIPGAQELLTPCLRQ